ncbi:secreted protein [Candidatus Magnetobacterium bavaricum]|uniref:Secreted protein n=1 Tax=Candidatus Magnetobacterium bavaricum TaxID=29290 RepID=A0A0F3GRZ3_9BACT|nr:secreted protein [Candidatus Magnetobacterium bavaricum]
MILIMRIVTLMLIASMPIYTYAGDMSNGAAKVAREYVPVPQFNPNFKHDEIQIATPEEITKHYDALKKGQSPEEIERSLQKIEKLKLEIERKLTPSEKVRHKQMMREIQEMEDKEEMTRLGIK